MAASHPAVPEHDSVQAAALRYRADVTPLKSGGRSDWIVPNDGANLPTPIEARDFVTALRRFFAEMDAEIDRLADDPVATAQALARMETLLGDMRYVRDRLRDVTAASMNAGKVRRLTVQGVVQVEASSTYDRTDWQDEALLVRLLRTVVDPAYDLADGDVVLAVVRTGETIGVRELAAWLMPFFRLDWRLTPLRDAGIDPDDYSTVERDDAGKYVRRPTVKVNDNRTKGQRRP